MIHLNIIIQSLEDAESKRNPILPNTSKENIIESEDITVGILEGGMQSGGTSLMICLPVPGYDDVVIGQISESLFEGLISTYRGAQTRFKKKH